MLETILAEFPPAAPGVIAVDTCGEAANHARPEGTLARPGVECAVLVVHPSLAVRAAVLDTARERDMHCAGFSDLATTGHYFRSGGRCSVLFCAFPLPDADVAFAEFVSLLRGNEPAVQIIAIARDSSAETIRESMRAGVLDCLSDPPVPAAVHRSLLHALHVRRLALANHTLERAREAERHHYESMLENASAAIVETTTDLEVTYMNRAAERLLGKTAAGLVGRCLVESLYPDSDYAMGVREIYESTIRSGLVPEHVFTTTVSLPDHTSRSVRWSARVYDHASHGKRILSVGEDMTAAAQLEERVRSLINELNRKNHELTLTNGKNERLQQLVRQYVPQSTWRRADLHAARGSIQIPIEQMELTCLFMDVAGFTAFTENSPIEDVVAFLNEVFAGIARIVDSFGGDIDKFMGDACFAVFESPLNACGASGIFMAGQSLIS